MDEDTSLSFAARFSAEAVKDVNLSLRLGVLKNLIIEPGQDETELLDTTISLSSSFESISWSLGVTLPTSKRSQDIDRIGTVHANTSWNFRTGGFSLSGGPKLSYYFNRFTSTPTDVGDNGGQMLRKYKAGIGANMSYSLNEFASFSAGGAYSEVKMEELGLFSPYVIEENDASNFQWEHYASASLSWNKNLSTSLTYSLADYLDRYQGQRLYLYDPYVSSWTFTVGLTF